MEMTEADGRALADLPKWGEPLSDWIQDRPNTLTNAFGVVNEFGQGIKGLQVEFNIYSSSRLALPKYVFSLIQVEHGCHVRAYQLELNRRTGLRPTDHAYSHEHYGNKRINADSSWGNSNFDDAVKLFCSKCNLILTDKLPDYNDFKLK